MVYAVACRQVVTASPPSTQQPRAHPPGSVQEECERLVDGGCSRGYWELAKQAAYLSNDVPFAKASLFYQPDDVPQETAGQK